MTLTIAVAAASVCDADDYAIVVGVNQYPRLSLGNLSGCVSDAEYAAGALESKGFRVKRILDVAATRSAIVDALKQAASQMGKADRFVFYFAGHGSEGEGGKSVILPHDAQETTQKNDIPAVELEELVKAIPAGSKTVLLDSCFSGGMLVSSKSLVNMRTRYHKRQLFGSKDVGALNANLNANLTKPDSNLCYFAASRMNEQAHETRISGKDHGVFTYHLVDKLKQPVSKWGELQTKVNSAVSAATEDKQHPTLSSAFVNAEVLAKPKIEEGIPLPPPKVEEPPKYTGELTVWDRYNEDRPDPAKVQLQMEPDQTTLTRGTRLKFWVTAGMDGYLVILNRGTSGKIWLIHPISKRIADAKVTAGSRTPTVDFIAPDLGTERVKAILFTFAGDAEEMMASVPTPTAAEGSKSLTKEVAMHLTLSTEDIKPFFTSDFMFEVVETPAGASGKSLRAVAKAESGLRGRIARMFAFVFAASGSRNAATD